LHAQLTGPHTAPTVSQPLPKLPSQSEKPAAQRTLQAPPSHVGSVFAGPAGHGVQRAPQDAGLASERHCSPQAWVPAMHVKTQALPVHTAVALTRSHRLPQPPQCSSELVVSAQVCSHGVVPAGQVATHV